MTNHDIVQIFGPLASERGAKTVIRRIRKLLPELSGLKASARELPRLFKANIHDHIDCSLRYETMLELWDTEYNFDFRNFKFPDSVTGYWRACGFDPSAVAFPQSVMDDWHGVHIDPTLSGAARSAALKKSRAKAAAQYREFLVAYGGGSLFQYVQAIVVHVLPLMQNAQSIIRIMRERLEDGVAHGEGLAELRGAPQLHTWSELTLEGAVRAYLHGIRHSPYPAKVTLCALRHEDARVAWNVAKLAGKYRDKGVGCFDLAADEASNPGVLNWWVKPAILAALFGIKLTVHLWETDEPTLDDIRHLNAFDSMVPAARKRLAEAGLAIEQVFESPELEAQIESIIDSVIAATMSALSDVNCNVAAPHVVSRLGHGFRGSLQGSRTCEVCFSSNVATKQVESIVAHPAHKLFHSDNVSVTINTDGTTLVGIGGLLDEYRELQKCGWDAAHFLISNVMSIVASSFSSEEKIKLLNRCVATYEQFAHAKSRRR